MDDKEKEKFGVIIDKNDQDTENQPKVDESTEDKNIYKESVTTSSETSTNPEQKQTESDKTSDVLDKNEVLKNLESNLFDLVTNCLFFLKLVPILSGVFKKAFLRSS